MRLSARPTNLFLSRTPTVPSPSVTCSPPLPLSIWPRTDFLPLGANRYMISEAKHFVSSRSLLLVLLALCLTSAAWAGQWTALGPDGGDVRSLAYDPQNPDHIFLGTSTGSLFASTDGGKNWSKFAHLGSGDDYVIDHLVIDPQNTNKMYAAAERRNPAGR